MIVKVQKGSTIHMFDSLDTPGGHMVLSLVLIVMGWTMIHFGDPDNGKTVLTVGYTSIAIAMKGLAGQQPTVAPPPGTTVKTSSVDTTTVASVAAPVTPAEKV